MMTQYRKIARSVGGMYDTFGHSHTCQPQKFIPWTKL